MQDTTENKTDSMISRILMVSPDQSELFKRNKSRIYIGVEGESMIDTILNQVHRPIDTYVEVSHRAIVLAGLQDNYGDIRGIDGMSMAGGGIAFLTTTDWLKDDKNNVFDLYLSLDPDYEPAGLPNVEIMQAAQIENGVEGENPLILSCDIENLFQSDGDQTDDNMASVAQDGAGTSNREPARAQSNQNQPTQNTNRSAETTSSGNNNGGTGNGQHSDMSKNDDAIAARRSTDTGGEVPGGRGDDDRQAGGQGRVKSETDGRLKENRDQGLHIDGTTNASNDHAEVGGQGRVQNENDGRLKANIDAGVKIGDGDNKNTEQQAASEERTPAMARQNQGDGDGKTVRRGRVTSPHDRRLRRNRSK